MAATKYCEFFEIDTEYFPVVDEELINKGKVDWRKFYPHASFIDLLKGSMDVLENIKNLSMWVEGAYGTGKSYAVFTLEKLLTESEDEVRNYFNSNPSLNSDLLNRLLQIRKKKLLIVNKYGSSSINSDLDMIGAIQTSIKKSLEKNGYSIQNQSTLESIVDWLSQPVNKQYFNNILQLNNNADRIGYNTVDEIISILKMGEESIKSSLVNSVVQLSQEWSIDIAGSNSIEDLHDWIRKVTLDNGIDCLFFIWDEFTEFFSNRKNSLTGFQKIAEMSSDVTNHFKLLIVTHSSDSLLSKDDREKIKGRFVSPTFKIDLPENMALELIANALKNKDDQEVIDRWNRYSKNLMTSVTDSANVVKSQAKISEDTIQRIIPITPFAALMLRHLSAAFQSNQRSMFNFIKNTSSSDIQGFQWFIENTGPMSDWNLLTVDMLWNYFYENGKDGLDADVRLILDSFDINKSKMGSDTDLHRVCKAILLLQAMSNHVGDHVSLFKPTLDNLKLAFDGSPLLFKVEQKANTLVNKQVLTAIPDEKGVIVYTAESNSSEYIKIQSKIDEELKTITTDKILNEASVVTDLFKMKNYYSRLFTIIATKDTLKVKLAECKTRPPGYNKIDFIIVLASKEDESSEVGAIIDSIDLSESPNIILVDGSKSYFGMDNVKSYVENSVWEVYHTGRDTSRQKARAAQKAKIFNEWKQRLESGKYFIHTQLPGSIECRSFLDLKSHLLTIVQKSYPLGIENFKIARDEYYELSTRLKIGAQCAIKRSNEGWWKWKKDELKSSLEPIWDVDQYWTKSDYSGLPISRIKIAVEELISSKLETEKTVSLEDIDDLLSSSPYGFIHCDLSAYYLAFILSDYASSGYAIYNGGAPISDPVVALSEAIKATYSVKDERYSEWFISPISDTIANFYDAASRIFNFTKVSNVDSTVDHIRASVRNFEFPIWTLSYSNDLDDFSTQFIDLIGQIIGTTNASEKNRLAELIGKLCSSDDQISEMSRLLTKEHCWEGMRAYLNTYKNGDFWTYSSIFKCPNALQLLADKQTDDSAWLWNVQTTQNSIDECIDEFKIISKVYQTQSMSSISLDSCRAVIRNWFKSLILPANLISSNYPEYADLIGSLYRFMQNGSDKQSISNIVADLDKLDQVFKIYSNSQAIFRNTFEDDLALFDDQQIEDIISEIGETDPNSISLDQFNKLVKDTIANYSKGLKKHALIQLWREKTSTESPKDWSLKHLTPIEALFDNNNIESARLVIQALNGLVSDGKSIEKALKHLKSSNMLDLLNDQRHIDTSFRLRVLRQYSQIFEDLDAIRSDLYKKQKDVDLWMYSQSLVEELAKKEYDRVAKARALKIVDSIPLEQLQEYLRSQVESNMNLGIELLRDYK